MLQPGGYDTRTAELSCLEIGSTWGCNVPMPDETRRCADASSKHPGQFAAVRNERVVKFRPEGCYSTYCSALSMDCCSPRCFLSPSTVEARRSQFMPTSAMCMAMVIEVEIMLSRGKIMLCRTVNKLPTSHYRVLGCMYYHVAVGLSCSRTILPGFGTRGFTRFKLVCLQYVDRFIQSTQ